VRENLIFRESRKIEERKREREREYWASRELWDQQRRPLTPSFNHYSWYTAWYRRRLVASILRNLSGVHFFNNRFLPRYAAHILSVCFGQRSTDLILRDFRSDPIPIEYSLFERLIESWMSFFRSAIEIARNRSRCYYGYWESKSLRRRDYTRHLLSILFSNYTRRGDKTEDSLESIRKCTRKLRNLVPAASILPGNGP